jgi:non-ribosomal peptide synthetase component F
MRWFVDEFNITNDDHALLVSSMSFDLTQKNLFATLMCGGTLHLYPPGPFDLSVLSRLIHERGITLINCTPSVFYPLIDPFDVNQASLLASLRIVFLGGEPISIARIRPWISNRLNTAEVANTYGPTECTDICGFYRLTKDNLDQYDFVPLGRAISNVQMAILHPDRRQCEVGETGELCVGGAGVGAGYINDAELTRERFVTNWLPEVTSRLIYRTGDQARRHEDGVIEFLGRLDHQVKIRGYRIELPEIERAMESHPAVQEAIVIVKHEESGGNPQLIGCYTQSSGQSVSQCDLRCHLTQKLPEHMIPSTLLEYTVFPLSPNGKVDRKVLSAQVQELLSRTTQIPEYRGEGLEHQISDAWSQVLDGRQAGLNDNFFDSGGDSLRLARLHQIIESMLGRKFPITELFAHPTIRGMSQHLGGQAVPETKQLSVRDRARLQREAQASQRRSRA